MSRKALWIAVMSLVLLAGCGGGNGKQTAESGDTGNPATADSTPQASQEPATIIIHSGLPPDLFKENFTDLLSKKYSNVTFVQVDNTKDVTLQALVATTPIDLFDFGITNLLNLLALDAPLDLDPLVKKYKVDMNRFDSTIVQSIRSYSDKQELIGLPTSYQPFVLYYNKDIFDKFGAPYPKDGSTWDELIELSKKVGRSSDGVLYRGLDPGLNINRMQTQLSLPFADKMGKSVVGSLPNWKMMYQTYQNIYNVPGNSPPGAQIGDGSDLFIKDKTLAMYPHLISVKFLQSGVNLGITTFPVFKNLPDVATGVFGGALVVSKTSKQQDLAFQIANYYTSDDVQIALEKLGSITPLVSKNVQSKFLDGDPLVKSIDLTVPFKLKVAAPYYVTQWDKDAQNIVKNSIQSVITNQVDINTALRDADEKINALIKANPAK